MLIDPSLIGDIGEQKVKAYDAQTESLAKLESLSGDEETKRLVAGIREIDDSKLKKLDESLLEMLLGDEQVKAKETYFQSYLPERKKYAALVHDLPLAGNPSAWSVRSGAPRACCVSPHSHECRCARDHAYIASLNEGKDLP